MQPKFKKQCQKETLQAIYEYKEHNLRELLRELDKLPDQYSKTPIFQVMCLATPVPAIKAHTER